MSQTQSLRQMIEFVFTHESDQRLVLLPQLLQAWVQSLWTQITVGQTPVILGTLGARVYNAAPYPKSNPTCLVSRVTESGPFQCFRHVAFGLAPILESESYAAAKVTEILTQIETKLVEFRATLTEATLFTLPQVTLTLWEERVDPNYDAQFQCPEYQLLVGLSSWVAKPKDVVRATDPELIWFSDLGQGGWETSPLAESMLEIVLQPVAADAATYNEDGIREETTN